MLSIRRAANLSKIDTIKHGFFGRTGGVSEGVFASLNCGPRLKDPLENVVENMRRVVDALASGATLLTLSQVHGSIAIRIAKPWEIGDAPQADAMVSNKSGLALGILAADCAPLLLADPEAGIIGAAHAGWKGARAGVVRSVVAAMEELGATRSRIAAAIGPCISQAQYEVGPEVRTAFVSLSPDDSSLFAAGEGDRFHFDLESCVARRLSDAGVGSVERLSTCTYADDAGFFSFRRATHHGEAECGRQISAIGLCK